MKKFANLSKIVFGAFIVCIAYALSVAAPQQQQQTQRAQVTKQTPQEKKQQFEQQAVTALPEVTAEYTKILTCVNSGKMLSDPNRNEALKIVARNRKFLPAFNEQQKIDYYTLSAWVYYFDNKQDKVLKQISAAQKITPQNSNFTRTHLALSLIYKDYVSASEILASHVSKPKTSEDTQSQQEQSYYQQPLSDQLSLDVNDIRADLLGKTFDIRPQSDQNSNRSVKDVLCVLLWKIEPNTLDSFAPAEVNAVAEINEPNAPRKDPNNPAPSPLGTQNSGQAASPSVESQPVSSPYYTNFGQPKKIQNPELEAFSKLQNRFTKDTKAVFVGINFNDPSKTKNLENWLIKNSQPWQTPMPSAEQQQKITSLLAIGPNEPMLLIVGPDSKIRYTGKADGFLPQMIIRNILDNPQEFAEPNEPNKPNLPLKPAQNPGAAEPVKTLPRYTEPNKPYHKPAVRDANESHKQSQAVSSPAVTKKQSDENFAVADDYQAEKLLSNARTFLKIGNRLPSHIYRSPIEMCRQVMKDYPNTKYSQEAQTLLRNVPKEYRQQYNLTDEELGL